LLDFKFLEQHFSDLAVRIGLAQPRASQVWQKHYECQPDTLRMLVTSTLVGDEALPLPQLAERLKRTLGVCFGGCVDDHAELQEAGYLALDEDEDLRANRAALVQLLKTMDLAVEPSDGLLIGNVRRWPKQMLILPVADPRHEFNSEQIGQTENGRWAFF
jgi:hypothetical protein